MLGMLLPLPFGRGENSPKHSHFEPPNQRGRVSSLSPSEGERAGVRGPFARASVSKVRGERLRL